MRVAVTGATGFIGGAIVRALVANKHSVCALVRPESAQKWLPSEVERITGSLSDDASLTSLVRSADIVIHCAGTVRGAHVAKFMQSNAVAVERLAVLVLKVSNASRIVHLSSLAASHTEVSAYAASKRAGELALERSPSQLDYIALRPPAVYGPGDRELLPLFKLMSLGVAPIWGDSAARFSLIYITDLVDAVLCCLDAAVSGRTIYSLHDGHPDGYSMGEVIGIAEAEFQRRVRGFRIPSRALDVIAKTNLTVARLVRYDPMLTPWKLRELRHPRWVCDNTAFHAATGWSPQITLAQGLPLTLRSGSQSK